MKKLIFALATLVIITVFYIAYLMMKANNITRGKEISEYENPQKALLVIDLQRDLTEKDGKMALNIPETDSVICNLNKILQQADSLHLNVVYISQVFKKDPVLYKLTKGALQASAPGTAIDPRIKIVGTTHFIKHISDAFSNPELDKYLVEKHVNQLYITGIDAAYCVDKTIKGAKNRNYNITVIKDAVGSRTAALRDKKLRDFEKLGIKIMTTKDILQVK